MRNVVLTGVDLVGFKSFREPTTFRFDDSPGLRLLAGQNLHNARLGGNGAGKSTLASDAIVWCLYGSTSRGSKASELVSWGGKAASVTTHWRIDGQTRAVRREGPPNRLYVDDEPAEQTEVDALIGLTQKRFLYSVVFGQAAKVFLDLSVPERGQLLDEICDLGYWVHMSDRATKQATGLKADISDHENEMARLFGSEASTKDHLTRIQQQHAAWEQNHAEEVDKALKHVEEVEKEYDDCENLVDRFDRELEQLENQPYDTSEALSAKTRKLTLDIALKRQSRNDHRKRAEFFKTHWTCPTCDQPISNELSHTKVCSELDTVDQLDSDIERITREYDTASRELESSIDAIKQHREEIANTKNELTVQRTRLKQIDKRLQDANDYARKLCDETVNPWSGSTQRLRDQLRDYRSRIRHKQRAVDELKVAHSRAEFWKQGFKRVRLFLLKRTLMHLQLDVANAAASLGLDGWRIQFTTEVETKSGSLRPGIRVSVREGDNEPWEEWSGGEEQRIKLAVTLGLSSLIQRLSGVWVGFDVLDEPTQWLSPEGIEDLLELLKQRAVRSEKVCWLLDHRALMHSSFSEVWEVTRRDNGSTVARITKEA